MSVMQKVSFFKGIIKILYHLGNIDIVSYGIVNISKVSVPISYIIETHPAGCMHNNHEIALCQKGVRAQL